MPPVDRLLLAKQTQAFDWVRTVVATMALKKLEFNELTANSHPWSWATFHEATKAKEFHDQLLSQKFSVKLVTYDVGTKGPLVRFRCGESFVGKVYASML